jgi:hypothetical protein
MEILNWNILGIFYDPDKWPLILNKISKSGEVIIGFQETKKESFDLPFITNFCPRSFDSFLFLLHKADLEVC